MQYKFWYRFLLFFALSFYFITLTHAQGWDKTYPDTINGLTMLFDAKPTPDGGYIGVGETDLPTGAIRHFIHLVKTDANGNLQWQKNINDNTITYETGRNIWPLEDGGYMLVGTNQLQPFVTSSIYLLRLDELGDTLWTREHLIGGFTVAESLYPTADGGYIIGGHTTLDFTEFFLYGVAIKVDANGMLEWSKEYNFSINKIHDLVPTSDGGYIAAGGEDSGALLMRLDENGDTLWTENYQLATGTRAYAVLENIDGSFVMSGSMDGFAGSSPFILQVDENGQVENSNFIISASLGEAVDISHHPDGGYVVTGSIFNFTFGNPGAPSAGFISKVNIDGSEGWIKILSDFNGNDSTKHGASVEATSDGGFIISGTDHGAGLLIKTDSGGNSVTNFIQGHVVFDENENCIQDSEEMPLENWIIEAQRGEELYYASTNADGFYQFNVDTGAYQVRFVIPNGYWESCTPEYSIELENFYDTTTLDFLAQAVALCPNMQIEVSTPFLRRCFDNNYYVNYCNTGTEVANGAFAEISLDPFLSLESASLPYTDLGNNVYSFNLGTIELGECGQFSFTANLDCDDTTIGQTHCVEAHIFPDSLCIALPGASPILDLDATCEGDSVVFTITNIGDTDMTMPSGFIVIEDDVMFLQDLFQLDIGESIVISLPANGSTYRLETSQFPDVSGFNSISVTIEGCGFNAAGGFSMGFFNTFSLNDDEVFVDIECRQSIGSYDPNDKQAFPTGYGENHFIEKGVDLDYLIRFQNTGTDTAFRVEIKDTLSAFLDRGHIIPGTSSHPYRFSLSGNGIATFTFDDIMLPDSTINEPASHGFIKFKIAQNEDLPLGTRIENRAGIYFDFNAPVITNTTFHTIGQDFIDIINTTSESTSTYYQLQAFPNPANSHINFQSKQLLRQGQVTIYSFNGQAIKTKAFSGLETSINVANLPKGIYFFNVKEAGRIIGTGKFVAQ